MRPAVLLVPGQLHAPRHGVGLGIDHLDGRFTGLDLASETRHDELLVRRHEDVVDRQVDLDALDQRVGVDVDHVDERRKLTSLIDLDPGPRGGRPVDDTRVDLPVLLVDRDLVRSRRQRDLLHELEGPRVEHVDGLVHLVRAVVVEAFGVRRQVVRIRTAPDEPHDLVAGRIDDVVDVAGVVALQNPHGDPVVGVELRDALRRCRSGESNAADDYQDRTTNA